MGIPATQLTVPHDEQEVAAKPGWQLKSLSMWHKNVASLIAQGIARETIAAMMDCAPQYVSQLAKQPLMLQHIQELSEFANIQLESQFAKTVVAIGETLENGDHKSKMAAARLQAEMTGRIGSRTNPNEMKPNSEDRLIGLSERLVGLLENKMADEKVRVYESEDLQVEDANFSDRPLPEGGSGQPAHEPAQDAGLRLPDSEVGQGDASAR